MHTFACSLFQLSYVKNEKGGVSVPSQYTVAPRQQTKIWMGEGGFCYDRFIIKTLKFPNNYFFPQRIYFIKSTWRHWLVYICHSPCQNMLHATTFWATWAKQFTFPFIIKINEKVQVYVISHFTQMYWNYIHPFTYWTQTQEQTSVHWQWLWN